MVPTILRLIRGYIDPYLAVFCCVILCLHALTSNAHGQDDTAKSPTAVTVAPAGAQRFASGQWAALSVVGVNPTDRDSEEVVSVFLDANSQLQYSTKFWLPAHSKRQTWMPIRIPSEASDAAGRVELSMIRLVESDGVESFANNFVGMPVSKRSLMLTNNEINTGLLVDPPGLLDTGDSVAWGLILDRMIHAGRDTTIDSDLDLPSISFVSNFLPQSHGALDELDQIVITGNQLCNDTRGMTAVRHWLRKGGRVWIMLDVADEAIVTGLLGQDASHTVIDRIELNQLQFEMNRSVMGRPGNDGGSWSSESPVPMVRVLADIPDEDIVCQIDGWPAAFWKSVGNGEVLFTTLDARGWLDRDGNASNALHQISRTFFEPKNQASDFQQALMPILDRNIGYQIPSRRLVATILGLNALVILVAGTWWARQRRLERMAILVPASAIITTIAMLAIGTQHAQSVPSTVATGQVVQVSHATGEADVSTVRAVYSQDAGDLGLVSRSSVLTIPVENEGSVSTRRVRIDDDGSSRWLGADQPPGVVRHFLSDSTLSLDHPINVRGTFDASGFRGTVLGIDSAKFDDGVIVHLPAPLTGIVVNTDQPGGQQDSERQIRAGIANRLAPEQFVPGTLLSDEQRIHQEFLRDMLSSPDERSIGNKLSLLFWTDPFDLGVQFSDRFQHRGSALVFVPIQIDRPASGSDFLIPATFIRTEPVAARQRHSSLIDHRTGQWIESLTKPGKTDLIFQFPPALSAMTLQSVTISMKINAPSRSLLVHAMVDGKPETMYEHRDPTGLVQFTIDRKDALHTHAENGLWLSIEITESDNAIRQRAEKLAEQEKEPESLNTPIRINDITTWQIDYVYLDAVGRIQPDEMANTAETSKAGRP